MITREDRELMERDTQERDEWLIEWDWEAQLLDAWEAMQPKVEQDSELASVFMPILPGSQEVPF